MNKEDIELFFSNKLEKIQDCIRYNNFNSILIDIEDRIYEEIDFIEKEELDDYIDFDEEKEKFLNHRFKFALQVSDEMFYSEDKSSDAKFDVIREGFRDEWIQNEIDSLGRFCSHSMLLIGKVSLRELIEISKASSVKVGGCYLAFVGYTSSNEMSFNQSEPMVFNKNDVRLYMDGVLSSLSVDKLNHGLADEIWESGVIYANN